MGSGECGQKEQGVPERDGRCLFPMGVTRNGQSFHVNVASDGERCDWLLYRRKETEPFLRLPFSPALRTGRVWALDIGFDALRALGCSEAELLRAEYNFENEEGVFADPCGRAFSGRERWAGAEQYGTPRRSRLFLEPFDWGDDRNPRTPFSESIIYRLHVRGFTRAASSAVPHRGSFRGITEKIPYLKALGITAVELLPCQEFEELMPAFENPRAALRGNGAEEPQLRPKKNTRLNYWGYSSAFHFAPKASYCGETERDPAWEFREMVKEMHRAGIEVIPELYFDGNQDGSYVTEVLRYYVRFFHVDGIHLTGDVDFDAAARDPYLAGIKLIAESWQESALKGAETELICCASAAGEPETMKGPESPDKQYKEARKISRKADRRRLASCGQSFLRDMRRFLKGDEGMLHALIFHTKNNPVTAAVINCLANTNGFTMADMVCYDEKHNEKNGEENRDGADANFSWNCGAEGPTRRKKVLELRKQQLKNAYLLLFLSQGTPLLLAGDEFGNSQGGNNNAYCQDNAVSWLDWKQQGSEEEQLEFVKRCIAFRKKHGAFHRPREYSLMDPDGRGIPDLSYHGMRAWQPEFEPCRRQLGVLYSGYYAKDAAGREDSSFYVLYNLHWEAHEFALPRPGRDAVWHLAVNTADAARGFFLEGEEPRLADQQLYTMSPRSIAVMISRQEPAGGRKAHGQSAKRRKNKADPM